MCNRNNACNSSSLQRDVVKKLYENDNTPTFHSDILVPTTIRLQLYNNFDNNAFRC